MSTALTTQQPAFPSAADFEQMRNAAALIARSNLVPEAFRGKPEDVLVAVMTARGLGLDPMVALQKGYVVKGKFDIEVSVKLGLIQSRVPDFDYEVVRLDDEACTVKGGRAGKNPVEATFTYAQAVAAGLTQSKYGDKETWKFYRRDMLFNRALGRVLKMTCAHALYNMPIPLDEPDFHDDNNATTVAAPAAERSGAVVVEDAAPTPAAPPPPAEPASQPVPEDWTGRLLRAVAKCYGRTEPGTHKNAYQKWLKQGDNAAKVLDVANLFYAEAGEPKVDALVAMPPMDKERVALWLEARNEKRAGAGAAGSGGTEAAPAQEKGSGNDAGRAPAPGGEAVGDTPQPEPEVEMPPDDDEPAAEPEIVSGWQRLVEAGHLRVTNLLMAMRHATKNERQFVQRSPKGRYALADGALLKAVGSVNDRGTPVAMWMDDAQQNERLWAMTCRAIYDTAVELNVSTQDI